MIALRAAMKACDYTPNLILRSRAERGVSKDGNDHLVWCPSFETHALVRMRLGRFHRFVLCFRVLPQGRVRD